MSSILENARCYLSGPIEYDDTNHNWRDVPKKVLVEEFKVNLFDPFEDPKQQWIPLIAEARNKKDYAEMSRIAHGFVRKDLSTVDRSDFIIAYLPKAHPTTGTHHEIISSNNSKKPTLLVCPQGKEHMPLWYYGFIRHEFMFGSWEELFDYLRDVNAGKHHANDRWAFLYGLI